MIPAEYEVKFFEALHHGPLSLPQIKHFAGIDDRELRLCVVKFTDLLQIKHTARDSFFNGASAIYRLIEMPEFMPGHM